MLLAFCCGADADAFDRPMAVDCHRVSSRHRQRVRRAIRQAFFVQMVGKEDLPNAIALNSSIFNGARAGGPAIAGFAIALVGPAWCFF